MNTPTKHHRKFDKSSSIKNTDCNKTITNARRRKTNKPTNNRISIRYFESLEQTELIYSLDKKKKWIVTWRRKEELFENDETNRVYKVYPQQTRHLLSKISVSLPAGLINLIGDIMYKLKSGQTFFCEYHFTCSSKNVIYAIKCKRCKED